MTQEKEVLRMALDWITKQNDEVTHTKYDVNTGYAVIKEIEEVLAQPQRKPLTDKQLNIIGSRWHLNLLGADEKAELFAFARAIEAAHGIGENT